MFYIFRTNEPNLTKHYTFSFVYLISLVLNNVTIVARKLFRCISPRRTPSSGKLLWCNEYVRWSEQLWSSARICHEPRFISKKNCWHQVVCRVTENSCHQLIVQEIDRYGQGVILRAGMHNGRTPLYIFDVGTMTFQQYYTEIGQDHAVLTWCFLFIDDNSCRYRTNGNVQ